MFTNSKRKKLQNQLVDTWVENFLLKKKLENYEQAFGDIAIAIQNKGIVPKYQEHVTRKHRDEWPELWRAIDRALTVFNYKKED
jgi:hypothetical protein